MKSAEPYAFGAFANRLHNAGLHLAGGFVCERKPKDIFAGKLQARFEQVADSLGNDASLAGSGAGDDQQGTVAMLDRATLLGVQS
jgi:hypothetical protein